MNKILNDSPIDRDTFKQSIGVADSHRKARLKELDHLINTHPLCIFGYGGKGKTLAQHIQQRVKKDIIVFDTDAKKRAQAKLNGFNVFNDIDEVKSAGSATILGACQFQLEQAKEINANFLFYQEAAYIFDMPLLSNRSREFTDQLLLNQDKLFDISVRLPAYNQKTFLDILCFRVSLNPSSVSKTRRKNEEMWFDVIQSVTNRKYKVFLDVGAYDGDTLYTANRRLGVSRGIAVEANKELFPQIASISRNFKDGVQILPTAAWSKVCNLTLEEVRGGMIQVREDINGTLPAAPIDNDVFESVDLLKMDIEGAELMALVGARHLLHTQKPDLAIAAYHRPLDMISLINFLDDEGLSIHYSKFIFEHYSDCFDDTILYCVS